MLKIKAVRPSNKTGVAKTPDGRFSIMEDGRLYFMVDVKDPSRIALPMATRMFAQQGIDNPTWKIDPDDFKVGAIVGGRIEEFTVAEYKIGENTVSTYRCAIFEGENATKVLKSAGHTIAKAVDDAQDLKVVHDGPIEDLM